MNIVAQLRDVILDIHSNITDILYLHLVTSEAVQSNYFSDFISSLLFFASFPPSLFLQFFN